MTVIIPLCLTSAFAADTKASELGLDAVSKAFEQSLTARGKHSPSRTWLRRWKTDSWMQLLFSRTFQLSHGSSSLRSWLEASCPLAGHASRFQQQENEKQRRTSGGSSTSLQMELPLFDQECFSQRTSKDSCPQKCQTVPVFSGTASRDWSGYITGLRQAYSARLNAERLTSASGSSSWPSPVASEVRQGFQDRSRGMRGSQESLTTVVIKGWPTPNAADSLQGGSTQGNRKDPNLSIAVHGPPAQASSSTDGSRQELWQTATVSTGAHKQKDGSMTDKLDQQVKSWATPSAFDGQRPIETQQEWEARNARKKEQNPNLGQLHKPLTVQMTGGGKLNPRWVETLMGLPVGWTMPSCASPVTIERTNSDYSETASSQQQQNEPSGL